MYRNIVDIINLGIVVIDDKYRLVEWNRWMEIHSGLKKEDILNTSIYNHFPQLSSQNFTRACKTVLNFGNIIYFSQKLHNYLFPFRTTGVYSSTFEYMQQSCSMAPAREDDGSIIGIIITIQDVTERVFLEKSLRTLNMQDSLTGIGNRRLLDKRLSEEFLRHKRYGRDMTVVMADIDDFKSINDTYGHQFGDTVLKEVAGVCSSLVRAGDVLARFGGEEFCIILPETGIDGASSFSERLRNEVSEMEIMHNGEDSVSITVSLGISGTDQRVSAAEDIVRNADIALYRSKQNGKNMATVYLDSRE